MELRTAHLRPPQRNVLQNHGVLLHFVIVMFIGLLLRYTFTLLRILFVNV